MLENSKNQNDSLARSQFSATTLHWNPQTASSSSMKSLASLSLPPFVGYETGFTAAALIFFVGDSASVASCSPTVNLRIGALTWLV